MSFVSQIDSMSSLGFSSRILLYHLISLEKMLQIRNDNGKDLSLNQLSDLVGAMNWKLDRDIQSIQFSETGGFYWGENLKIDIDESAIELPEDMDPQMHMLEGALLNNTEEKTALMCLSLEYMYMGRTSFTFVNEKEKEVDKNKKFLMIGDLFYALGASTAAKTKSLFFL